jgi:hypothetical protein
MSNVNDLNREYEVKGQDAQQWLEQAKKLKLVADLVRVQIPQAFHRTGPLTEAQRIQQLALFEGYMMLCGMAFEVLIKGIEIAGNPTRVANNKLNMGGWKRGGHGLSDYAQRAKLSEEKTHLLRRMEENVVWAGRYPIPREANSYINSRTPQNLQSLRYPVDFELEDELFDELSEALVAVWSVNGALKW